MLVLSWYNLGLTSERATTTDNKRKKKSDQLNYQSLELRKLLAGDVAFIHTNINAALLPVGVTQKEFSTEFDIDPVVKQTDSGGRNSPVAESEDNDTEATAQLVPPGFDAGEFDRLTINGQYAQGSP